MKVAYFDLAGGASGDMILGALVDAGAPVEDLRTGLGRLGIEGWALSARPVLRGAIAATQVIVHTPEGGGVRGAAAAAEPQGHAHEHGHSHEHDHAHDQPHGPSHDHAHGPDGPTRTPDELIAILDRSGLPRNVVRRSVAVIRRIAEAEAAIHAEPVDRVHLHEVGSLDTLIDVAGAFLGLDLLGIERIHVSAFPLAHGMIDSRHGPLPLPAPATLALLRNAPVRMVSGIEAELVTPTGAAILTSAADGLGDPPPMRLQRVGHGAGSRELPFPNVLRLWLGDATAGAAEGLISEPLVALECNMDDMPGEHFGYVMERLFAEGALDVALTPIQMKKNRPATRLWALARPHDAARLVDLILAETTTLGVRRTMLDRISLPREVVNVQTPWGEVRVKLARLGTRRKIDPEFEDLRRLALATGIPIAEIEQAATEAASRL